MDVPQLVRFPSGDQEERSQMDVAQFIWLPSGDQEERSQMDVAQLVRFPSGDQEVMGSTPTFHSGIQRIKRYVQKYVIER